MYCTGFAVTASEGLHKIFPKEARDLSAQSDLCVCVGA
jgi:hypothetical protein